MSAYGQPKNLSLGAAKDTENIFTVPKNRRVGCV